MKATSCFALICASAFFLVACGGGNSSSLNGTQSPSSSAGASQSQASNAKILDDISGVWRASHDGTMVTIVYADKKFQFLLGENAIPAVLGAIDDTNSTINLNVTLTNGKPAIWTIRQVWDNEAKDSFHLLLTLHDGTEDQLSFVRKVSSDDLNVLASAESRVHAGAIGDAAGSSAAATNPSAQSPQPSDGQTAQAQALPPATNSASPSQTPPSVANVPSTSTNDSAAVTWQPSFDCSKVSTGPERLICSNKNLSEADVQMAQAYRAALDASNDKDALRNEQSEWRRNQRDACSDVPCMMKAYQNRIAELSH